MMHINGIGFRKSERHVVVVVYRQSFDDWFVDSVGTFLTGGMYVHLGCPEEKLTNMSANLSWVTQCLDPTAKVIL